MIALPPGCTVNFSIWIDVDQLSKEMVEWYQMIGGEVKTSTYYDHRGKAKDEYFVRYGQAKFCHHHQNGSGGTRLHWYGDDASTASVFLIKFFDHVTQHNLREQMERVALDKY
jgi:hypothetical protein